MILLYRVAIRLLASERMRAHTEEMIETAAHLSAEARSRGARHYARYWAREFRALLTTSLRTNTEGTMQYPDRKALPMLSTVLQDVRYSIRLFLRTPGITAAALLTLALGIGANTAIFSIIDGVLLRPLPYPDADRLSLIQERTATDPNDFSRTRCCSAAPDF